MRVNIYEEELTDDVQIVSVTPTGPGRGSFPVRTFYGVRVFLKSHDDLHHTAEDDDRSAVTFWVNTQPRAVILRDHLRRDLNLVVRGRKVE